MEGVDADFPPNAADLDRPNEQLSPPPEASGSPTQCSIWRFVLDDLHLVTRLYFLRFHLFLR